MPLTIQISDEKLEYLTTEAKNELKMSLLKYTDEIIEESGRLEAAIRRDNNRPEITRSIMQNTVSYYQHPYRIRNKSIKRKIAPVAATISAFISGLLYDFDKFSSNQTLLTWFLIAFIIFIIANGFILFSRGDE